MWETSVRLLRLLALLQARPVWHGADLADRLGVTTRTVRNDVERLRGLGYHIHSATGTAGGYRLGAGAALPPLLLDDEEAIAVTVSLHAAAGGTVTGVEETSLRALAKLRRMLPARLRHRVDALADATISVPGQVPTVSADTLTTIAAAIRDHECLRFDYRDHDGTASVRVAEPYRLVHTGRRWYLLAWDRSRADWRTFRADRIEPRTPGGPRFTPRRPPDDVAAHVVRGTGSTAWRHQARVHLRAPIETLVRTGRLTPAAGLLTPTGDGTAILETGSGTLHDLATFLGGLDVPFTVLDPPELRELLSVLASRFAEAVSTGEPGERGASPPP